MNTRDESTEWRRRNCNSLPAKKHAATTRLHNEKRGARAAPGTLGIGAITPAESVKRSISSRWISRLPEKPRPRRGLQVPDTSFFFPLIRLRDAPREQGGRVRKSMTPYRGSPSRRNPRKREDSRRASADEKNGRHVRAASSRRARAQEELGAISARRPHGSGCGERSVDAITGGGTRGGGLSIGQFFFVARIGAARRGNWRDNNERATLLTDDHFLLYSLRLFRLLLGLTHGVKGGFETREYVRT